MVEPTPLNKYEQKYVKMGSSSPIFGVKIKHIRNHHLAILRTPRFFPTQPTDLTNRHESSNLRHRIHFFQLPKFAAIFHQKVPPWLLMATGNPAVAPVEIGSLSHEFTGIQKPSKRWWLLDFWPSTVPRLHPKEIHLLPRLALFSTRILRSETQRKRQQKKYMVRMW